MLFKEDEDGSRNEAPSVQSAEELRNLAFGGFAIERKCTFSALFEITKLLFYLVVSEEKTRNGFVSCDIFEGNKHL